MGMDCDEAFDIWYAAQRHQLTNESLCRLIWRRGWEKRGQQFELAMEGADEAFGHIVEQKQDLEKECKRLRDLLDSAYAQIRQMHKPSNALSSADAVGGRLG